MKWDAVVVGAGIGGLSVASLLAKSGMRVGVFEKSDSVGGRARSKRLEDGSVQEKLRILPSADRGEIASLLNLLGVKIEVVPFEEILTYHQGKLISDKELIQDPAVKKEVDRVKIEILTMGEDEMRAVDDVSFEEWISERIKSEEALLYFRARLFVFATLKSLSELSAGEMIRRMKRWVATGIHSGIVKGGWITIYEPMMRTVEENGGAIFTNRKVDLIEVSDGTAGPLVVDGERVEADVIILNPPIWEAVELIETDFPGWFLRMVEFVKENSKHNYVGMRAILKKPLYEGHKYISIVDSPIMGNAIQLFQPTNFMETGRKKGEHILGVAVLTDMGEKEKLEEVKKTLPEELEAIFSAYDLDENCIEKHFFATRDTVLDGVRRSPYLVGGHKLDVKAPGIKNLYFAGDTVLGRGSSTASAVDSAFCCVNRILRER